MSQLHVSENLIFFENMRFRAILKFWWSEDLGATGRFLPTWSGIAGGAKVSRSMPREPNNRLIRASRDPERCKQEFPDRRRPADTHQPSWNICMQPVPPYLKWHCIRKLHRNFLEILTIFFYKTLQTSATVSELYLPTVQSPYDFTDFKNNSIEELWGSDNFDAYEILH